MDDVDVSYEALDSPGDYPIVECHCTHGTQQSERNAEFTFRQCRTNPYAIGHRPSKRRGKYKQISPRRREPVDLLPCGITDPICPESQGKTVRNSYAVTSVTHASPSNSLATG